MPEDTGTSAGPTVVPGSLGPCGSGEWEIQQGECLAVIAEGTGLLWNTIWDHPANSALRSARKDPNVLLPGDKLHIPDPKLRQESGGTDHCHRFRLKTDPCHLKLTLLQLGKPRTNEPYQLITEKKRFSGKLDGNGTLDVIIRPETQQATLILSPGPHQEKLELALGSLDPGNEVTGIQARLENLGYDCGGIDGTIDDEVRTAIAAFQDDQKLNVTGNPDEDTWQALLRLHKAD